MDAASISWGGVGLTVGALLGLVVALAFARRAARRAVLALRDAPAEREARVRWLLAQHWARAALVSGHGELWRPACMALALAALASRTLYELETTIRAEIERADVEAANIWRQALAELTGARSGKGAPIAGADEWPWPVIHNEIQALMQTALGPADRIRPPTSDTNWIAPPTTR